MKELVICTMFRDSMLWKHHQINQVERFFRQMKEQSVQCDIYAIEGDSQDNTYEALRYVADSTPNLNLIKFDMGNSPVTSDAAPKRYQELAALGNHMLEHVAGKYRYMLWIESDLIITNKRLVETLLREMKRNWRVGAMAPMIYIQNNAFRDARQSTEPNELDNLPTIFYDSWGFESRLCNFRQVTPYDRPTGIIEASSVGSCVISDLDFVNKKGINFGANGCFKGFCSAIIEHGKLVKVNTDIYVLHPGEIQVRGRWI